MNKFGSVYHTVRTSITGKKPEKKTFFLHVPKCGGTSITEAVAACYETFSIVPPFKRTSEIAGLNSIASMKGSEISGLDLGDYREQLLFYFLSIDRLRYFGGHFTFSKKAYEFFGRDWAFVTMLRHPVSRWFSHYFFNRYKDVDHCRIEEDIQSFVDSDAGQRMGHFYTYYFTGKGQFESVSPQIVDEAIENLKKFSVVGCLEHLDLFVKQFEQLQKIKIHIKTTNKNPIGKSIQEKQISAAVREKVEKICQPDMKIYNFALSRLQADSSGR